LTGVTLTLAHYTQSAGISSKRRKLLQSGVIEINRCGGNSLTNEP
jgi:hypothetical protein